MDAVGVVVGLAVVVIGYVIVIYNRLVTLRTRVEEAWSGIQVQMKRRYDLIPNLVETVKGYARHEAATLAKVVEARNAAMADQGSPAHQAQSESLLGNALRGLFALAEEYPELKANQNFLDLQQQLAEVEDELQAARRYYNGATRDLNILVEQFPSNLVARRMAFKKAEFFELDEADAGARQPVKVAF